MSNSSSRNRHSFRPVLSQLEAREVLSVAAMQLVNGILTVQCNNSRSNVLVTEAGGAVQVQDTITNQVSSYAAGAVRRVDVIGGSAADAFTVRGGANISVRMYGNGGNDLMYGGAGRDIMIGGAGADKLYGRGGNDHLDGGDAADWLDGGDGNDIGSGGNGNDQVTGGLGIDAISGDSGNDVLVSIDNGVTDRVDGGTGTDFIWVDQTGSSTDQQTGGDAFDTTNAVTAFANAGADRTLTGDRIADPTPLSGDKLERFTNRPLFSSQGPQYDDISQGQLGDCWLLAGLGSTALYDPNIIRSRVVDFGDGTYGVHLGDKFYRVDNDLPVAVNGSITLQYTAPGIENSLWVAIMEKAYTHFRTGDNTYSSIEGGFSYDVFPTFNLTPSRVWFDPTSSAGLFSDTIKDMIDAATSPTGTTKTAPTVGFDVVPSDVPLIAAHQYILLSYTTDAISGLVSTITVRNPWGTDGPGSSPGTDNDSNFDDGILVISLDQLQTCEGSFEWGNF